MHCLVAACTRSRARALSTYTSQALNGDSRYCQKWPFPSSPDLEKEKIDIFFCPDSYYILVLSPSDFLSPSIYSDNEMDAKTHRHFAISIDLEKRVHVRKETEPQDTTAVRCICTRAI